MWRGLLGIPCIAELTRVINCDAVVTTPNTWSSVRGLASGRYGQPVPADSVSPTLREDVSVALRSRYLIPISAGADGRVRYRTRQRGAISFGSGCLRCRRCVVRIVIVRCERIAPQKRIRLLASRSHYLALTPLSVQIAATPCPCPLLSRQCDGHPSCLIGSMPQGSVLPHTVIARGAKGNPLMSTTQTSHPSEEHHLHAVAHHEAATHHHLEAVL